MKKFIIAAIFLALTVSCAHHHAKDAHHHDNCDENCATKKTDTSDCFQHKCASSISEGDIHVEGKEEYKITHGGNVYYFSTLEKKNKFEKNLEKNIELAKSQWEKHDHEHGLKK